MQVAIRLAALLHDADDKKYFPQSKNLLNKCFNAQKIAQEALTLVED
jgi:hypothetical protein